MVQIPFQNNATCNRTCVYKLVDNDYFNLEDSYIARARPAYIATDPSLAMVRACPSSAHTSHTVAGTLTHTSNQSGQHLGPWACHVARHNHSAVSASARQVGGYPLKGPYLIIRLSLIRTRPTSTWCTSDVVSVMQVPIADLDKATNGSVLAAPLLYIPSNEVANSTTERGLRFHMLRANTTSYINELVRMYYYTAQVALGNKACSAG